MPENQAFQCPIPDCRERLTSGMRLCIKHAHALIRLPKTIPGLCYTLKNPKTRENIVIIPLPKTSDRYIHLESKFRGDWTKANVVNLQVELIADVHPSPKQLRAFKEYKDHIKKKRGGDSFCTSTPLYHGTHAHCEPIMPYNQSSTLCGLAQCGVCGIMLSGFNRGRVGNNVRGENYQRLGKGFYFAPHPSKCHYYSQGAQRLQNSGRFTQIALRCLVVVGKSYNATSVDQNRTKPPDNCDSVYGGLGTCAGGGHGALNYPEYCIFDERAAIAVNYIVYSYQSTSEF